MKIKNYQQFLLESILQVSGDLQKFLGKMKSPLAPKLIGLINKDIKTKYNLLKLSQNVTDVSFAADSKVGELDFNTFKSGFNTMSVGRLVRHLLENNNIEFTNTEIEDFVNEFKYLNNQKKSGQIKIVEGEDIRKWYNEENYFQKDGTELYNSCMKHEYCQKFFDIYVKNPGVIRLIILLDENNLLRARALVWKTSVGYYVDRVYHTEKYEEMLIQDWAKRNVAHDVKFHPRDMLTDDMSVRLTDSTTKYNEYDFYPYMDTFQIYIPQTKTLYTQGMDDNTYYAYKDVYILDSTNGLPRIVEDDEDDEIGNFLSNYRT